MGGHGTFESGAGLNKGHRRGSQNGEAPTISDRTSHLFISKSGGEAEQPMGVGVDDCLSCSEELKKSDPALSPR